MENDLQRINREILSLRADIADLSRRLEDCEAKPEEILETIERIWASDPEVTGPQPDKH